MTQHLFRDHYHCNVGNQTHSSLNLFKLKLHTIINGLRSLTSVFNNKSKLEDKHFQRNLNVTLSVLIRSITQKI